MHKGDFKKSGKHRPQENLVDYIIDTIGLWACHCIRSFIDDTVQLGYRIYKSMEGDGGILHAIVYIVPSTHYQNSFNCTVTILRPHNNKLLCVHNKLAFLMTKPASTFLSTVPSHS